MEESDLMDMIKIFLHGVKENTTDPKSPAVDEYIKELLLAKTMIESTCGGTSLSLENTMFIKAILANSSQFVDPNLLDESTWDGKVPAALFLENMAGEVDMAKINHQPSFQIRGKHYMKDRKKVSVSLPLFYLRGMQLVERPTFEYNVAIKPWCAFPKYDHCNEWFILNYLVPGSSCVHVICMFSASNEALRVIRQGDRENKSPRAADDNDTSLDLNMDKASISPQSSGDLGLEEKPWHRTLKNFWKADPDYCSKRFKMIPTVVEGNWAIKMAVGQKPALTGTKLVQKYYRGQGYFEVDIDISSSAIANRILGLVRGVSKTLVVDIGITIQGETEEELPEAILCHTRFNRVELDAAVKVEA